MKFQAHKDVQFQTERLKLAEIWNNSAEMFIIV